MLHWIQQNSGTIFVLVVLTLIVALVICKMIQNRKRGKSSCGCGCSSCAMADVCHGKKKSKKIN